MVALILPFPKTFEIRVEESPSAKKEVYLNPMDILQVGYKEKNHIRKDQAKNSNGTTFSQLIYRPESGQKATSGRK